MLPVWIFQYWFLFQLYSYLRKFFLEVIMFELVGVFVVEYVGI